MAITDELRKYATVYCHSWLCEKLLAIADSIDTELAERYVELPKDADGEYIHEGDKVEWRSHDGVWNEAATVAAVCSDGCYINVGLVVHVSKFDIRHYHEPTVEDLLREFGKAWTDWTDGSPYDPIAKYAKKLRLAESENQ